jgi:RES domain-containing protein
VVVHAATYRELGQYRAFRAEFDEGLAADLAAELPADWNDVEPARASQELGTDWARSGRSLLLRVPSAVIPHEHNYLLNVEHLRFRDVSIDGPLPFHFDPRLERFNRPA